MASGKVKAKANSAPGQGLRSMPILLAITAAMIHRSQALPPWFPPPQTCQSTHQTTPHNPAKPAPPLPVLPQQYSMRVEANIVQKQWTTEVEEHYDDINQRASLATTFNGSTTVSIYNFDSGERYDIYPNGTCIAGPATMDYFGFVIAAVAGGGGASGEKPKRKQRPSLATVNEVFRFGAEFNETYVGKEVIRGIPVNHWTSCQEWTEFGAKFQLDFYFSDPDFVTASGNSEIPVRAVLNGSANNVGMLHEKLEGTHRFEHVYEFVSVRPGKPLDDSVFEIPPGVVCRGRQDTKPLPELPDRFEMNMEMIMSEDSHRPHLSYMRYDYPHMLLETGIRATVPQGFDLVAAHADIADHMQTMAGMNFSAVGADVADVAAAAAAAFGGGAGGKGQKGSKGGGSGASPSAPTSSSGGGDSRRRPASEDADTTLTMMSMSTVEDFHAGLVYVLDKMSMTCGVHPMPEESFKMGMSHGANLLHVAHRQNTADKQAGFAYQGQTTVRQLLVDVWAMEEDGLTQELYYFAEPDFNKKMSNMPSMQQQPQLAGPPPPPSGTDTPKPKPKHAHYLPYPILVGMFMKNSTAENASSLASLFRDVFKPDAMQWTGLASSDSASASVPVDQQGPPMGMSTGDQMAWGIQLEKALNQRLTSKLVHIYDYQPLHSDSTNFQVSLCYPDDQISQVMILVRTNYDTDVLPNFAAFSNSLRQALAKESQVSLIQIANLIPMPLAPGSDMTTVTFSLLGMPKKSPILGTQLNVDQAKGNLTVALQRGVVFNVAYTAHSKSFIVDKKLFFMDYDKLQMGATEGMDMGDAHGSKPGGKHTGKTGSTSGGTASQTGADSKDDNTSGGDGYTGGAMAGVALAMLVVGAAAALGAAYVYQRTRRPSRGDSTVPYQMTSDA